MHRTTEFVFLARTASLIAAVAVLVTRQTGKGFLAAIVGGPLALLFVWLVLAPMPS